MAVSFLGVNPLSCRTLRVPRDKPCRSGEWPFRYQSYDCSEYNCELTRRREWNSRQGVPTKGTARASLDRRSSTRDWLVSARPVSAFPFLLVVGYAIVRAPTCWPRPALKGFAMQFPTKTKPLIWGAVGGAVA